MKTIFVVDDSDTNLSMVETALEDQYNVITIPSAQKMFLFLKKLTPDLILLDIEMPEMNGIEALQKLKSSEEYRNIPVIFLTGRKDIDIEVSGFRIGAVDFITKPFSEVILKNRVKTRLGIDQIIRERTAQLYKLKDGVISVLAEIVEYRDISVKGHVDRTTEYMKILINAMKERGVYADELQKWDIDTIVSSARLHDIGKIVVSDEILNKNARLNSDEYEIVKCHALEGERIIGKIAERTKEEEFLNNAKIFAGCHHERWDGTGYLRGLKGTEIPLQGRIMAIIDVYDALVSKRPHRNAYTDEEAVEIIMQKIGKKYDPKIAEVFYEVKDHFKAVRKNAS
ncbi:MAG: response regulator [Treponema sp.]|jgi:putative two-component system response regulator|nr:response regulator [Treponema sp.]